MIKVDGLKIINYEKVTNDWSPSFSGIVSGECKGNLWVDNIENPNIAIAESYAVGSFAFLGNIQSKEEYKSIEAFIKNELFIILKAKGIDYFEFSIENDSLKRYILKMFYDREMQKENEYKFRTNDKITELFSLTEEYKLYKVDYELWNLINRGNIQNGILVTERILESWENFDTFIRKSSAFCVVHLNKIIAVIVGTGRFNNIIPIDIYVEEEHRNKGLGLILTREFVNECIRIGVTVQWDCMESNSASQRLAEKAGFKFIKRDQVYWFDI
jgi:RimJ/RimL family protein N-acetyltransferase